MANSSSSSSSSSSSKYESVIIPLLAQKSYHLPGNTWGEDWVQYMRNNHIVFGVCFHHRLHPIERWERIIVLLGSMSFALMTINIYYLLWHLNNPAMNEFDPNEELFTVTSLGSSHDDQSFTITKGMALLWTVGSICHSLFDVAVWQAAACSCFHPGGRCYERHPFCSRRCKDFGSYSLIPVVLTVMALAGYASYLRVNAGAIDNNDYDDDNDENAEPTDDANTAATYGNSNNNNNDDVYTQVTGGAFGRYSFLLKYAVELLISWFICWPIVGTAWFCVGRPRDVARVKGRQLTDAGEGGLYNYARF